jgi:hypothetical protein
MGKGIPTERTWRRRQQTARIGEEKRELALVNGVFMW